MFCVIKGILLLFICSHDFSFLFKTEISCVIHRYNSYNDECGTHTPVCGTHRFLDGSLEGKNNFSFWLVFVIWSSTFRPGLIYVIFNDSLNGFKLQGFL